MKLLIFNAKQFLFYKLLHLKKWELAANVHKTNASF